MGWNLPRIREVCSRDTKEVWDDGMQGHEYTYGIKPKVIEWCFIREVDATMYHQIICSLMYLTYMRPDICLFVNTLIQFLVNLRHVNLMLAKHTVRYLKGTIDYGL